MDSVSNAKTLLEVIDKATNSVQNISSGWHQANEATKLLPVKRAVQKRRRDSWESLLDKHGLQAHQLSSRPLRRPANSWTARSLSWTGKSRCCGCFLLGGKLLFPTSVIQSFTTVIEAFESLPKLMLE
ncbi:unnamed protein product [Calypogeia fissa]